MGKSSSNVPNVFKDSSLAGHRVRVYIELRVIFITFFNISSFTAYIQRFWMQMTNSAVFAKIFICQNWAFFPIWQHPVNKGSVPIHYKHFIINLTASLAVEPCDVEHQGFNKPYKTHQVSLPVMQTLRNTREYSWTCENILPRQRHHYGKWPNAQPLSKVHPFLGLSKNKQL